MLRPSSSRGAAMNSAALLPDNSASRKVLQIGKALPISGEYITSLREYRSDIRQRILNTAASANPVRTKFPARTRQKQCGTIILRRQPAFVFLHLNDS